MPNKAIRNEYAKIGVDKFYQLHRIKSQIVIIFQVGFYLMKY